MASTTTSVISRPAGKRHLLLSVLQLCVLMRLAAGLDGDAGMMDDHDLVEATSVCDDAKSKLWVDWDWTSNHEYQCQENEELLPVGESDPTVSCLSENDRPEPYHKCMSETIQYKDQPPRGGYHRPHWAVYGEYVYIPPQRWIHNLEHGAAVFLYHPCADNGDINALRNLARSCLRKHVITPYRNLTRSQPLAIVTWGCKLTMTTVDMKVAQDFIKAHAMQTGESLENEDGKYELGLIRKAQPVAAMRDALDLLCPRSEDEPMEEHMTEFYHY